MWEVQYFRFAGTRMGANVANWGELREEGRMYIPLNSRKCRSCGAVQYLQVCAAGGGTTNQLCLLNIADRPLCRVCV